MLERILLLCALSSAAPFAHQDLSGAWHYQNTSLEMQSTSGLYKTANLTWQYNGTCQCLTSTNFSVYQADTTMNFVYDPDSCTSIPVSGCAADTCGWCASSYPGVTYEYVANNNTLNLTFAGQTQAFTRGMAPTVAPTLAPTKSPTLAPTKAPTKAPTTAAPTKAPTKAPTNAPTTAAPTPNPTMPRPSGYFHQGGISLSFDTAAGTLTNDTAVVSLNKTKPCNCLVSQNFSTTYGHVIGSLAFFFTPNGTCNAVPLGSGCQTEDCEGSCPMPAQLAGTYELVPKVNLILTTPEGAQTYQAGGTPAPTPLPDEPLNGPYHAGHTTLTFEHTARSSNVTSATEAVLAGCDCLVSHLYTADFIHAANSSTFVWSPISCTSQSVTGGCQCPACTKVVVTGSFTVGPGGYTVTLTPDKGAPVVYSQGVAPSAAPTSSPSTAPTLAPTKAPTPPSVAPTSHPSSAPSFSPTSGPTAPPPSPPISGGGIAGIVIGAVVGLVLLGALGWWAKKRWDAREPSYDRSKPLIHEVHSDPAHASGERRSGRRDRETGFERLAQ